MSTQEPPQSPSDDLPPLSLNFTSEAPSSPLQELIKELWTLRENLTIQTEEDLILHTLRLLPKYIRTYESTHLKTKIITLQDLENFK